MSSNWAKNAADAAQMAEEILKTTINEAAINSKAAEIIRKKEKAFNSATEEIGGVEGSISEAIAKLPYGKSARTARSALKKLAEQLYAAEATATQAAKQMREVAGPQTNGETLKEATAKSKPVGVKKGGPEKLQTAKDSEAESGKNKADADAQGAKGDDINDTEKLRAVEAAAIERATNILSKAGSLAAEKLSRIADELRKAEDVLQEAAGELHAAEWLKMDSASKKVTKRLQAMEAVASEALEKLKEAVTALKKMVRATQDQLKRPNYDVWKAAYKKISDQAKIVDETLEAAKKAFGRSGSSAGNKELEQLEEYKRRTDEIKREARNSYDSAMVMEELLDVREFFLAHKERIYERLEECDRIATAAVTNADMLFFAESLPIINGIIHVGSTREELIKATDWVKENWEGGEAQPRIVLSALLFRYVTKEGAKEFTNCTKQSKKEAWSRIDTRVSRLLEH
jgi:hypothetical protein